MLRVRVMSPAETTGRLLRVLTAEPGVRNVVVWRGDARRPDGDAVEFDVRRGAANAVFGFLRSQGLDRPGAVTVGQADVVLAAPRDPVGDVGSPRREITPVWELVDATIRAQAVYAPSFFVLLTIAGLIAAVGILTNSQILIVAAMVVGPEYSAIIAVALAIARRHRVGVRDGLVALSAGFAAAIIVTYLFTLAIHAAGLTPDQFVGGVRPVASLIAVPNAFSVIIAILAGIVGVVSLTESRANTLIGVFISITTIPAAAGVGVFAALGSWHSALGSIEQLLLNVVLLMAVGAAGLRLQRLIWHRSTTRAADRQ
ncbi:MAG: DUF389 domain-containing protein [Actinomycetota bacterium]|nr:DUF389 domain-containing protein [Actinomycetota bacterium]